MSLVYTQNGAMRRIKIMCKAKNCQYYKICLAKYDCADFMCADYKAKPKKVKKENKK